VKLSLLFEEFPPDPQDIVGTHFKKPPRPGLKRQGYETGKDQRSGNQYATPKDTPLNKSGKEAGPTDSDAVAGRRPVKMGTKEGEPRKSIEDQLAEPPEEDPRADMGRKLKLPRRQTYRGRGIK